MKVPTCPRLPPVQLSKREPRAPRSKVDRSTIVFSSRYLRCVRIAARATIPFLHEEQHPAFVTVGIEMSLHASSQPRVDRAMTERAQNCCAFHLVPLSASRKTIRFGFFRSLPQCKTALLSSQEAGQHTRCESIRNEPSSKPRDRNQAREGLSYQRRWYSDIAEETSKSRRRLM